MAAANIPYGIGAYRRVDAPDIRLVNTFAEQTPAAPGKMMLLPRGGLTPYVSVGAGPNRGIFQQPGALSDALFVVSGSQLYSGPSLVGAVSGTARVAMAATIAYLLLATGDALRISDGSAIIDPGFPDGAGASSVAVLGGYCIAVRTGTRRLYFTLDPTVWDGLDYLSAEASTGNIVGIIVISDQLWVFTERDTEVFVLTGNADAPLQSVTGRVLDKGAISRDSIAKVDNTVFWVGSDGIVYRAASAPQRISDHGIEERISLADPDDIAAWTYPWFGHVFYVLSLGMESYVYDAATSQWHEVASYGLPQWRAINGLQYGQKIIAGDTQGPQLWALDAKSYADNGAPLERLFTVLIDGRGHIDTVTLDCTSGMVPTPEDDPAVIELRTSRDGGFTWTNWRPKSLGRQGEYRNRPLWRRLGLNDQDGRLMQFRVTDSRLNRVSTVLLNESASGRARPS